MKHYQDRNSWKRATELLMQAAEQDGDIEVATEQFERGTIPRGEVRAAMTQKKPRDEAGLPSLEE
jgi:hypothetical protein